MVVTSYRIDPERSTVTAVTRPMLDGHGPLEARIAGRIAIGHGGALINGDIRVRLVDGPSEVAIDVAHTSPEVDVDQDGVLILRGSATSPAGAFGLTGPPLLNPTVVLRWRAALVPDS
jgi:hypothetical protein